MTTETPLMLRPAQAAKACNVDERTVGRWIASGELKSVKVSHRIRLISMAELEAFIARKMAEGE